jgi:hypothetical protein
MINIGFGFFCGYTAKSVQERAHRRIAFIAIFSTPRAPIPRVQERHEAADAERFDADRMRSRNAQQAS